MHWSIDQGGLGILDLEARNEAIDIMWLKAYLAFGPKRPMWAYVADALMARDVPQAAWAQDKSLRINTFTQTWSPRLKSLCKELKSLISTAKMYGLKQEGLAFSRDIIREMPMWDHKHADAPKLRRLAAKSSATECLKTKHKAVTVADFEALANAGKIASHRDNVECSCAACTRAKEEISCEHPWACFKRADKFMDTLPPKWDPRTELPKDYEEARMKAAEIVFEHVENAEVFDKRITTYGTLEETFRIFTDRKKPDNRGKN